MPGVAELAAASQIPSTLSRVVLIGFMGAGKSTVGRRLASAMGWECVDLDDEIADQEGMEVSEIIARRGIAVFRAVESRMGREVLRRRRAVIAVGGGWPSEPGNMDLLGKGTLSVWLQVRPETALRRLARSRAPRPLLESPDPLAQAESLLAARSAHYRRAALAVDTESRSPHDVAARILELLRSGGARAQAARAREGVLAARGRAGEL